jgi:hypothetical protein
VNHEGQEEKNKIHDFKPEILSTKSPRKLKLVSNRKDAKYAKVLNGKKTTVAPVIALSTSMSVPMILVLYIHYGFALRSLRLCGVFKFL